MGNLDHNTLVSVVIITYNSSRYVIETLESVKSQEWKKIELIISDDGSTDDTIEICDKWIKENSHHFVNTVLITVPQNTGIPSNSNRGIRKATGEWIKMIAGDDILLENCIADNLKFVSQVPDAKFIISDMHEIDDIGNHIGKNSLLTNRTYRNIFELYIKSETAKKQLKTYARLPIFLNSPSYFIERKTLNDIGLFDEAYRIYDDICLVLRANSNNIRLYYMDIPTVKYRIHTNSISRKLSINEIRDKEALSIFLKYRIKYLNKFNPIDQSVFYETWLFYKYKGFKGHKGLRLLKKFSLFYWYINYYNLKAINVKYKYEKLPDIRFSSFVEEKQLIDN